MLPERKAICDCGSLEWMADEPKCTAEFDAKLDEYHIEGASDASAAGNRRL
jgi:hypothetical protein